VERYVAFLRAINVGGRFIKMEQLADHFRALGCSDVHTFINSGNVVFTADGRAANESEMEARIEPLLGFHSEVFLRAPDQVTRVAERATRFLATMEDAEAVNVAFLKAPLDPAQEQALAALTSEIDRFSAHEREVYWLCKVKQSDSSFSNAVFERKLRVKATFRRHSMLQQLARQLRAKTGGGE
jgi:uncharacterized protein (DUF1697 family)